MVAGDCVLAVGAGLERACFRCAAPLTGRRTRWCSDLCSLEWRRNHVWGMAREAALDRDGRRCVKCGNEGKLPPEVRDRHRAEIKWLRETRPVSPRSPADDAWVDYESERRRIFNEHERTWLRYRLEVNHIVPRRGAALGKNSCAHHLDNLETLCHGCHVAVTNEQREAARSIPADALTVERMRSLVLDVSRGLQAKGAPPAALE